MCEKFYWNKTNGPLFKAAISFHGFEDTYIVSKVFIYGLPQLILLKASSVELFCSNLKSNYKVSP